MNKWQHLSTFVNNAYHAYYVNVWDYVSSRPAVDPCRCPCNRGEKLNPLLTSRCHACSSLRDSTHFNIWKARGEPNV